MQAGFEKRLFDLLTGVYHKGQRGDAYPDESVKRDIKIILNTVEGRLMEPGVAMDDEQRGEVSRALERAWRI